MKPDSEIVARTACRPGELPLACADAGVSTTGLGTLAKDELGASVPPAASRLHRMGLRSSVPDWPPRSQIVQGRSLALALAGARLAWRLSHISAAGPQGAFRGD
jgi:hypothetical protein